MLWTVIPVLILVAIAIPSFRLLYFEADIPKPDVFIKAIGKQWYWTYEFPKNGDFQFDSLGLNDATAKAKGEPRLLGVDNIIEVPVNKVVEIETTGADVIHSWALPADGRKDGRGSRAASTTPGSRPREWARFTASVPNFAARDTPSCRSR